MRLRHDDTPPHEWLLHVATELLETKVAAEWLAAEWDSAVQDCTVRPQPETRRVILLPFYGTSATVALLPFYAKSRSLLPYPHPMVRGWSGSGH